MFLHENFIFETLLHVIMLFVTIFQGHLVDSCDKLIQDLNNELNWLSDTEQLLRDDQPISDEAYRVKSQLEAQRVRGRKNRNTVLQYF